MIKNKIYFISGVSGSGKTSTMPYLKELLSKKDYDVRDLDERGVPDGGGMDWLKNETRHWLDVAKYNDSNGKSTIICGFANPELFDEIYRKDEDVPATIILLDVSSENLRTRLLGRHSTLESIKEIERASSESLDSFIKNNTEFAPELKKIFLKFKYPIIDTNGKTPKEVALGIVQIINEDKS